MWQDHGKYRLLEVELGFSPSYALDVGPLLGNETLQIAVAHPSGSVLKVIRQIKWEKSLRTNKKANYML